MSFNDVIYSVPEWLLACIFVILFVAYSVIGVILVRKILPGDMLKDHNDLTAGLIPITGIAFAALMGFLIVSIWESYDSAAKITQMEAGLLTDLWRQSIGYPEDFRDNLQIHIENYLKTVIQIEWPRIRNGKGGSLKAWEEIEQIQREVIMFEAISVIEKQTQHLQLDTIKQIIDTRRTRLYDTTSGFTSEMWAVIIITALLTIASTWFFGSSYFVPHLIGVILLGASVGLLVFLSVSLNSPFRGDSGITSEYFKISLAEVMDSPLD